MIAKVIIRNVKLENLWGYMPLNLEDDSRNVTEE
jgi:hypothetical protein